MESVKAHLLPLVIGVVGLGLLLLGLFQIISKQNSQSNLTYQPATPASTPASKEKITVDVEGAVINPGVYKLDSDTRIVDSLAAAGGMSQDADRDYIQKSINLAQKLTDGAKIYIPRIGEEIKAASTSTIGLTSTSGSSDSNSVININTASATDLDKLPGVGAVMAQKIIDGRPYGNVNDLLSKKVVGQAEFDKIKAQIAAN